MTTLINEKVGVVSVYNEKNGFVIPRKIRWRDREYHIDKLGYHHRVRQGRELCHIFHVSNGTIDFRLRFESETMHWTLEELTDGTAT